MSRFPSFLSKSRLVASGLAVAALGAVALGYAMPHLGRTSLPNGGQSTVVAQATPTADMPSPVTTVADTPTQNAQANGPDAHVETDRTVRVDAPHAAVRVDKDSGKVAVRAPYTDVRVDPDKGRVRVRAPYVDLDIRW
jgi:hypothetical protein